MLESELCTLLHMPPSIPSPDLKTFLPCSDALWAAPNAQTWHNLNAAEPRPVLVGELRKVVSADSSFPLPASVHLSAFGAHVIISSLHLQMYEARQLELSGMPTVAEMVRTAVRRSLNRLGGGANEFGPRFGQVADPASPAHVCYHLAHIATRVAFADLEVTTRFKEGEAARAMTERLAGWMAGHAQEARAVALHAGQVIRLIGASPNYGKFQPVHCRMHCSRADPPLVSFPATYEPSAVFYSALCLHVFVRWTASTAPGAQLVTSPADPPALQLDGPLDEGSDPTSWVAFGGPASLSFVEGSLGAAGAGAEVLRAAAGVLRRVGAVWRIGVTFGYVLEELAG